MMKIVKSVINSILYFMFLCFVTYVFYGVAFSFIS